MRQNGPRHWTMRVAILAPYMWLAAFFLLPFLIVLKAAVMNEQRDAARTIHVNDRVWLSWTPEAGVLLTE